MAVRNGTVTMTADELRAMLAGEHGDSAHVEPASSPGPSPDVGRGRRRRGPDAGPRLTADRLHERAVATLYGLRGLSRGEHRQVLEEALALLER